MKTSTKILTGLVVVIFALPLLLAYTLKSKIEKGEYTVKKYKNIRSMGSERSGSFTAFKVVKVIAPAPQILTVHLKEASDMKFNYFQQSKEDSVAVYNSGDTLYIKYNREMSEEQLERDRYESVSIDVNLHSISNLVVDGAVVVIDAPSTDNLSITLKNRGVVKDGNEKKKVEGVDDGAGVSLKKEKLAEVAAVYTAQGVSNKVKTQARKNETVDIKEALIYRLLYRI